VLVEKLARLVDNKEIEGIADIRDESDREGIRLVIELKTTGPNQGNNVPQLILNTLFHKTDLQISFPGNLMVLTNEGSTPQRLPLLELLKAFISFR